MHKNKLPSLPGAQVSRGLLVLLLLQLFWLVNGLLKIYPYQIDDAFITYRYADNFLHTGSIAFNPGDVPVEGFTSQLWFWLIVMLAAIFDIQDVAFCGPLLGMASLSVSVALLWFGLQKRIGAWPTFAIIFVILSLPSVAFYAATGMEQLFFAFLVMFVGLHFAGYWRNRYLAGLLVFAAVWTRPEAIWLFVMLAIKIAYEKDYRNSLANMAALLAALAALMAYRYLVFGELLPNTFYAKNPQLHRGIQYLADALTRYWWFSFLILMASLGAILGDYRNRLVFLFGLSWLLVPVLEGGDWMPLLRFFLPAMLLLGFSVQGAFRQDRGWVRNALLLLAISPLLVYSVYYLRGMHTLYPPYQMNNRMIDDRARAWLDANKITRIAAVDMGTLFYRKDYQALDLAGLTDREIARMPGKHLSKNITADYLLARNVEVILFRLAKMPVSDAVLSRYNFDNDTEKNLFFDPRLAQHYDLVMILGYPDESIATRFWGYVVMARKDLHLTPDPVPTKSHTGFYFADYSLPVMSKAKAAEF